jgi:hypothetical protein
MNGFTKYITERPWEDTITTWFSNSKSESNNLNAKPPRR